MSGTRKRKKRNAFLPSLTESGLEDRLVLTPPGWFTRRLTSRPSRRVGPPRPRSTISPPRGRPRSTYARQSQDRLQRPHRGHRQRGRPALFDGRADRAQQATFRASIAGAVDATALRLSSQEALPARDQHPTDPRVQNALLGSGATSLMSRLQAIASSARTTVTSYVLTNTLNRALTGSFATTRAGLVNYFGTTPFNRVSVDTTGAPDHAPAIHGQPARDRARQQPRSDRVDLHERRQSRPLPERHDRCQRYPGLRHHGGLERVQPAGISERR